jgi:hypothetical protein
MSFKKSVTLVGLTAILGLGLVFSDAYGQNSVKTRSQTRAQVRAMFMDQNGDGICDFTRDHDNDGIPNCQDADWKRPQDGTGYMNQFGKKGGNQAGPGWNNSSFRNQQGPFGSGVCDGTGPKGKATRRGRG